MASRIELRGLRARVKALHANVSRLTSRAFSISSSRIKNKQIIARFLIYLKQTKSLAHVVRRLNPNDSAWRFYDQDLQKIHDWIEEDRQYKEIRFYSISELKTALEMVEGAASRVGRAVDLKEIEAMGPRRLASTMLWGDTEEERRAARSVLADVLEHHGLEGEANSLRKTPHTWKTDKRALSEAGIDVPRNAPSHYKKASHVRSASSYLSTERDPRSLQRRRYSSQRSRR